MAGVPEVRRGIIARGTTNPDGPPPHPHTEFGVSDDDMDAIAAAALGPEPGEEELEADPLNAGGSDDEHGFGVQVSEARRRTARLAARRTPHVRDVLSHRRRSTFLQNLAVTGNITMAAAAAGWSRSIPNSLRRADKDFAAKWDYALETAADLLEAEALRRAVHGVQKPVFGRVGAGESARTEVVGHVTEYSDNLLVTLLRATKPDKYAQRIDAKTEGSRGGVLVVPQAPTADEWKARAAANQAKYREQGEEGK